MSTPPRIDELRKKFDENPRRYFAPLANEYRKAGDLSQAIALCREFLPKQPGHMSGHIVFGQALFEAAELGEARSVFESALALDPENLIALRHLGDIAKTNGDAAGARRWYERVLDADPRNDDIAAQLATLGAGKTPINVPAYTDAARDGARNAAQQPLPEPPSHGSFTPAYGIGVGMDALPTPDSSMRAVDFDEVNARISGQTPLYTPAQPEPWTPPSSAAEAPSARFEPLDLDAMDAAGDATEDSAQPGAASAADEPELDAQAESEPRWQSTSQGIAPETLEAQDTMVAAADTPASDVGTPAPAVDEAASLESSEPEMTAEDTRVDDQQAFAMPSTHPESEGMGDPGVEDDPFGMSGDDASSHATAVAEFEEDAFGEDEFEDGLLAPEWPEASAIIAQIGTPRSMTPVVSHPVADSVADSVTDSLNASGMPSHGAPALPHGVHVTPDAVAAFGREAGEPEDFTGQEDVEALHHIGAETAAGVVDDARDGAVDATFDAGEDEESFADVLAQVPDEPESRFDDEIEFADDADDETEAAADETETATSESHTSTAFVTETMGELLVSQGFVERAVGVYEELVRRRPYDPVLTSRLDELRAQLSDEGERASRTTPVQSTPLHNTPVHNTPVHNTPVHNTPVHSTPVRSTPSWSTPLRATPLRSTPLSVPPYSTPAQGAFAQPADERQGALTSRELFARLAARRVPRRTPPYPAAVVTDAAEGLATLFSGPATAHDDLAARALADAFAPIPAAEMASGEAIDFAIERPSLAPTPLSSPAIAPPQHAAFSFDRFFPDRALQQPDAGRTPSAGSNAASPSPQSTSTVTPPGSAAPPATEDLAQFSAWLKGLGNS